MSTTAAPAATYKSRSAARLPQLDGLRGIAILSVLLFHFRPEIPASLPRTAFALGWAGVDLFFGLSGFLITGILLDTKKASNYFWSFYARRILRIFPVYFAALTILFLVLPRFYPVAASLLPPAHDRWTYWFYANNWTMLLERVNAQLVGHFWSLAIEEQFYLVWPLLVWILNEKAIFRVAVSAITGALGLRILFTLMGADAEMIHRNTLCRMDALLMGAVCALWYRQGHRSLRLGGWLLIPTIAAGAAVVAGKLSYVSPVISSVGFSLIASAAAGVILYSLSAPVRVLSAGPLPILGRWSYGIYVYHIPVYNLCLKHRILAHGWGSFALMLAVSIGIAVCSYELAEKHILALKSRFKPRYSHHQRIRPPQDAQHYGPMHCATLDSVRVDSLLELRAHAIGCVLVRVLEIRQGADGQEEMRVEDDDFGSPKARLLVRTKGNEYTVDGHPVQQVTLLQI